MKKTLVAVAVAGALATPAAMAAELSTNIYWSTAISTGTITKTTAAGAVTEIDRGDILDGGGNRLMLQWTDTLDNGLGLVAHLSFGNLNTAGSLPDFAINTVSVRNANIGLSGDFGMIQYGSNEHFTETDLIFDPSYADYGNSGDALYYTALGSSGFWFTRRDGDSIWYDGKDMNGFKVRAAYTFGPEGSANTTTANPTGTQIGLSYASGPLKLGINNAVYSDYENDGGGAAGVSGSEASMTALLASYDLGVVNIKLATWSIEQSGVSVVLGSSGGTATAIGASGRSIFVGMPVGGGTLWAQSSSLADQDVTVAGAKSARSDSGKDGWDIGYHHALNSNVNFFVRYGMSETGVLYNDDRTARVVGADSDTDATDSSAKTTDMMIGLQLSY
ncbi:MAG: porin [Proteobacteria bacterium]|nr:porin [Pseudomonadota bacterium]